MELFNNQSKEHLLRRLETRYNQGRLAGVYTLGRYFSPEEILREAKAGTPAGEEFLFAERKLEEELKKRI